MLNDYVFYSHPRLDLATRLSLVDLNLREYDSKKMQRQNIVPPVQSNGQTITKATNTRSVENLTAPMRRYYEKAIRPKGKKLEGKALEVATKSFLDACEDEYFKK